MGIELSSTDLEDATPALASSAPGGVAPRPAETGPPPAAAPVEIPAQATNEADTPADGEAADAGTTDVGTTDVGTTDGGAGLTDGDDGSGDDGLAGEASQADDVDQTDGVDAGHDVRPANISAAATAAANPAGLVLGDLQIGEVLGRGATGQVYRAVGPDGETVAVKLLRPELADEPQVVARLLQECKVVARIADPRVVRIRHLVAEGEHVGIVMDYVPGGDLRALLRREGALPPPDAARLAGQILLGLRSAHEIGIVHRDVKPENVLLRGGDSGGADGDGDVVITDFGIARQLEGPALTRSTGLLGTPAYIAPELASHAPTTPAVDVYSAGCLLYELLTGSPPFVGGPAVTVLLRHINEQPARPAGLPERLWALLAPMLSKDPLARPTAAEAGEALIAVVPALAGLPALPRASSDTPAKPSATSLSLPDAAFSLARTPAGSSAPATEPGPPSGQDPTVAPARADADDPDGDDDIDASGTPGPYALAGLVKPVESASGVLTPLTPLTPLSTLAAGPAAGEFDAFTTHTSTRRSSAAPPVDPNPGDRNGSPSRRPGGGLRRRAAVLIPVAVVVVLALVGTGLAVLLRDGGKQADLAANDSASVTATASWAGQAGLDDPLAQPTTSTTPTTPAAAGSVDGSPEASPALAASLAVTASSTPARTAPTRTAPARTAAPPPTTAAAPVPAPARPTITAAARSGAVLLTINQPSGGQVTGYQINGSGLAARTASSAGQVSVPVPDCDSHSFTATALGPGGSATSAAVSAVGCVPPGRVTGVTANVDQLANDGSGAVFVRWSAPADFGGASSVDYVLTITPVYEGYAPRTTTTSSTSFSHCMPAGRCPEYVTSIQARNAMGLGPKVSVPKY